ncbi:sugar ABC transporter ATP-binding protein [Ruminococcus gauvreauii]|uniref:Sugar ABC transporter ATP-binding protein n=1 Tax=Ruminococcus gauvreauii TaxID=438033 RepID=A0ABY5VKG0_9FIRM|nr:sugar ABC transporter ATP-binding protein [Ruminococcus gauvreauii]UWP61090.1 sugar ABC transporter ATP-binding protein [Ruminococcus gauvreauii]
MGRQRLCVKEVTKVFPGVKALDHVSLRLEEGEVLSLVGENGAGKSTLMKVLSGTYPSGSYTGTVEVDGRPVEIMNAQGAEKCGIGMIPQELNIQLDMTAAENVMLGHWPKRKNGLIDWKRLKIQAKKALLSLNIDLDVDIQMRSLNASMQQLVCIARALVQNPSILILDEPTAALTLEETDNLMKIIRKLKADGISCIYISHKLEEVFDISDRVVVMRNGCVVSEYEKTEIVPNQIIADMIGREMDSFYPESHKTFGDEVFRVTDMVVPHPFAPNKNMIDGVSFGVKRGEILGLAGLVGSGRSELLRAVYGALPRTRGSICVEGKECENRDPREAIKNGFFMVSEDRKHDGYVGTMTIRENMTLSIMDKISKHTFIQKKEEKAVVHKFFDYLKIKAPSSETSITSLSGGNQQKVIISRALATDMKVLFLDEPTRGIDVGAKAEIYKIINELAEEGLSIVVISSEMPELISLCDRFVVLRDGRIAGEFMKNEVNEQILLEAAALSL